MTEDEMLEWPHGLHMSLSKLREMVKDREAWCAAGHGVSKSWTQLSKRTTQQLETSKNRNGFDFILYSPTEMSWFLGGADGS